MKFRQLKMLALSLVFAAAATAAPRAGLFADDRTLGDPKAPVVMVEYFAPSCPHCAHFARTVFPDLKNDYIDTGKVLYVLRIFPLGPVDGAIAGLAKCQPPGKYYDFLDLAFRKQAMWDPDGYDIPDIHGAVVQLAGQAGLSPDQANRCLQDAAEMDRINRVAEDAAKRYDVRAVPTLVIDGKVVPETEMNPLALRARLDLATAAKLSKPVPHKVRHRKKPAPPKKKP